MPFNSDSLPVIIKRSRADLAPASSSGALRRSDAEVLARVHGGTSFALREHQKTIADEMLPDTCSDEMILRQANLRLQRGLLPATTAAGSIICTGQAGGVVTAGAIYQTEDGRRVVVSVDTPLAGNTVVPAVSLVAGAAGNIEAGTALTAVSPVDQVNDAAVVGGAGIAGGTEQETTAQLRAKVIRSYRIVAHGGSADDYETWGLEVPGVTRAWCRRNWFGPGTVGLFIMCDGNPNPFPDAAKLAEAQTYIETVYPVGADLAVLAPTPKPVHFVIHPVPDTVAVRASIDAALRDLIFSEAALGTTLLHTHQTQAISNATGEEDHGLIAPAGNVVAAPGELITFGDIAWA
ncbi:MULTISPECIES: baseplate J/gp47 family protein [unclassified Herbaspirillum]|uniref:baseplate J/gp47 family protein n=1 Tax=unclassified Herbaspirillum TaxID=2624150 RepID=UPI000E2EB677|nr:MULTISPECIES: baseplate J/gp47 family protein [unclassified Herbaspirillum]RFB73816.1 baseplate J/gp47 family protein [Herbaspirillum sp. 3R-3a1]TFI10373.1 baseplate J/gp47 family protein [Herbaspirillum sp. 3R11]TFI16278.1 baseplate J/gp47 family protein [Herbaspirillum sp. 3R-11]TFI28375.1 baseplate J/gp47 family protein [Herbaspirillum sp. 3C11]